MSAAPMRERLVSRAWHETPDILAVELRDPHGAALPPFEAGAHIDVHTPGGPVRPYSLCGDPADATVWQIAVQREPDSRGGSRAMHERLRAGDRLTVGLPRQAFGLHDDPAPVLLLGGGIGITPLLAMAETLHAQGRRFALHLAVREPRALAFADRLRVAPWADAVTVHCSQGADRPDERCSGLRMAGRLDLADALRRSRMAAAAGLDGGRTGPSAVAPPSAPSVAPPAPAASSALPATLHPRIYACGPQRLLQGLREAAQAVGWPADRLHWEAFGADPAAEAAEGQTRPFELVLARSGLTLSVPADRSALQVMLEAGVPVLSSCEQGVCGSCLTRVVEGRPQHRDQYLTPEEQAAGDQFLPCCSRAEGPRLVVDA
ncbi:MAG: hypothetical protein RIQ53_3111 [Pseudomonadota bacterium]